MSKITKAKPSLLKRCSNGFKGWQNSQDEAGVSQIMNLMFKQQQRQQFSQAFIKNRADNFVRNRSNRVFKSKIDLQSKQSKTNIYNSDNIKASNLNLMVSLKQQKRDKHQSCNRKSNYEELEPFQMKQISSVRKRSINIIKHDNAATQRTNTLLSEQTMKPAKTLKQVQTKSFQKNIKAVAIKAQSSIDRIYARIMSKESKQNIKTQISSANNVNLHKNIINTIILKGRQMKFQNTFKMSSARNNRKTHRTINCDRDYRKQNCSANFSVPIYDGDKTMKAAADVRRVSKHNVDAEIKRIQNQNNIFKHQKTERLISGNSIFEFNDGPIFEVLLNNKKL